MSGEASDLGKEPQRKGRIQEEDKNTPEERERKETARIKQQKRRQLKKEELLQLQQQCEKFTRQEPLLKSDLYYLSRKTETALEETEKLKKLVNVLSDQLKEANATNGVLQSQIEMWKDSYGQLLQRTTMMASVAKRGAEEASLDDFHRQRRMYNPRFQQ